MLEQARIGEVARGENESALPIQYGKRGWRCITTAFRTKDKHGRTLTKDRKIGTLMDASLLSF